MAKNRKPPTVGHNLTARAAGHWIGARQLHLATPISAHDQSRAAPFWLLLGFAAEIALKAILIGQGALVEDVKQYGHNLWRLYRAVTWPDDSDMADVEFVIRGMRKLHGEHFMRYGTAQTFRVPSPDLAITVIHQLVSVAMKAHGMEPIDPALKSSIEGRPGFGVNRV